MRKWIKDHLPQFSKVRDHPSLQFLGEKLHNPNLWHINRKSVPKAVSIGLFMAMVPMPFQMVPAAILAFWWGANLVISCALVWLTNPITMPPVYYFTYKLGTIILDMPFKPIPFEASIGWLWHHFHTIALPLYVGSILCGIVLAIVGNLVIRLLWRLAILRAYHKRKKRHAH